MKQCDYVKRGSAILSQKQIALHLSVDWFKKSSGVVIKLQSHNDEEYTVTIKRGHLDTLLGAAEWVLDKRKCDKVPPQAKDCLQKLIKSYREERSQLF